MFDPVPWFVGGGAQHSPEVARLLPFALSNGAEGIVAPGDLKVAPLSTPGTSIRVLTGSALVVNRAPGQTQQTYIVRNPTETVLPIAATPSGSGRSDLIVVRVEDPYVPGQPYAVPEDRANGPYVFARVIPNVPADTVSAAGLAGAGDSVLALARIDIPAGTGTITENMIKPLRKLALPRTHRAMEWAMPTTEDPMQSTLGRSWPDYRPTISVPVWATGAMVRCDLVSVGQRGGAAQGIFTTVLGGHRQTNTGWDRDAPQTGGSRFNLVSVGGFNDIRDIAGQNVLVQMEARQIEVANNPGYLVTVDGTTIVFDIQFFEQAV